MVYILTALIGFYVIVVTGMFAVTLMEVDGEFQPPDESD